MKFSLFTCISLAKAYVLTGNKGFEIIYINLERDYKRREFMERLLSKSNCNYSRFDAVDGAAIKNNLKKISDFYQGLNLSHDIKNLNYYIDRYPGSIGCSKSHWIVNELIASYKSDKPVLVLEDDIIIEYNFVEEVEETLKSMNKKWDLIFISSWVNFDPAEAMDPKSKLRKLKSFLESYSYIVNGSKAAAKLAKIIKYCPPDQPIDVFMAQNIRNGNIIAYGRKPALCSQYSGDVFKSNIETSNSKKLLFPIKYPLDKYLDDIQS